MKLSLNTAGGLLCLWSKEYFSLNNSFQRDGYIGLEGTWKEGGQSVIFVNVYSPCELELKRRLSEELKSLKENSSCDHWKEVYMVSIKWVGKDD